MAQAGGFIGEIRGNQQFTGVRGDAEALSVGSSEFRFEVAGAGIRNGIPTGGIFMRANPAQNVREGNATDKSAGKKNARSADAVRMRMF